jgi:hypothetical protein
MPRAAPLATPMKTSVLKQLFLKASCDSYKGYPADRTLCHSIKLTQFSFKWPTYRLVSILRYRIRAATPPPPLLKIEDSSVFACDSSFACLVLCYFPIMVCS